MRQLKNFCFPANHRSFSLFNSSRQIRVWTWMRWLRSVRMDRTVIFRAGSTRWLGLGPPDWPRGGRAGALTTTYPLPHSPTLNIDIVATQHWTISSTRCSFPMAPVKYFNDLTAVMFGLGEIWVFKSPAKCAGCQFCFKPREKRIFKTYFQPYANQQTEWDIFSLLFLQSL